MTLQILSSIKNLRNISKILWFQKGGTRPPKSPMSLTAPGIKGVVTDFADATPSATVAFQAVSAPELNKGINFLQVSPRKIEILIRGGPYL